MFLALKCVFDVRAMIDGEQMLAKERESNFRKAHLFCVAFNDWWTKNK